MITKHIPVPLCSPGRTHTLTVHRFGAHLRGPKLYLQAGLHADEAPGMLVLQVLMRELATLESNGQLLGEIVVVPLANPIGLGQFFHGQAFGRFALGDGINFNRGFADLLALAKPSLAKLSFSADVPANATLLRQQLSAACSGFRPSTEAEALKQALLSLALPCDTVLDLHCDGESVMHVYTSTPQASACLPLAQALGARALLTAEVSGDNPFDEAMSRPWSEATTQFAADFGPGCLAVTVELRGEADVSDEQATADANALLSFAATRGVLTLPTDFAAARCAQASPFGVRSLPLAGVEPLVAPISGVIVFEKQPGTEIAAGERVARILNPATGEQRDVCATHAGLLYARVAQRTVLAGRRIAKVAGAQAFRSGSLLSP